MRLLRRFVIPSFALAVVVTACATVQPDSGVGGTLTLDQDGIGPVSVGDSFQTAYDWLVQVLGGPDADTGDATSTLDPPDCGGVSNRMVSWGNFAVMFAGDDPDDLRLVAWTYGFDPVTGSGDDTRGLGLTTDAGIGLGSTRNDIERAHAGEVSFTDLPEIGGVGFTIGATGTAHIVGRLAPVVVLLELAPSCS
ncbi:MAG: hypothetical protein KDB69_00795 [Acidimicrobiia bacterium]|nr:hypothetical protein [Acidimicrobiia bacterium]